MNNAPAFLGIVSELVGIFILIFNQKKEGYE